MDGAEILDALSDLRLRVQQALFPIDHVGARDFRPLGTTLRSSARSAPPARGRKSRERRSIRAARTDRLDPGGGERRRASRYRLAASGQSIRSGRMWSRALSTSVGKSISVQGRSPTSATSKRVGSKRIRSRMASSYSSPPPPSAILASLRSASSMASPPGETEEADRFGRGVPQRRPAACGSPRSSRRAGQIFTGSSPGSSFGVHQQAGAVGSAFQQARDHAAVVQHVPPSHHQDWPARGKQFGLDRQRNEAAFPVAVVVHETDVHWRRQARHLGAHALGVVADSDIDRLHAARPKAVQPALQQAPAVEVEQDFGAVVALAEAAANPRRQDQGYSFVAFV